MLSTSILMKYSKRFFLPRLISNILTQQISKKKSLDSIESQILESPYSEYYCFIRHKIHGSEK